MTLENKINNLANKFRVYKPKTIERAIGLLGLYGDATDDQIVREIEHSIHIKSMSMKELDKGIEGIVAGALGRMNEV